MAQKYTPQVQAELSEMHEHYRQLLDRGDRWSLRALFSTEDCDIAEYCRDFAPNRFGEQACAQVEDFCREHGIWLEHGGAHYNSMTPYLHPRATTVERMVTIGIYNAILFWLNDTVGREKFGHLSAAEQAQALYEVDRLCRLFEAEDIPPLPEAEGTPPAPSPPGPIETATTEFLSMLADQADPAWLRSFRILTVDHLRPAIRDQNASARRDLLGVDDYIALRNEISGMYPAIALCDFARGVVLPWDRIRAVGLDEDVRVLIRLTAEIGALMNDVFSFEKECIVDRSDFNLVPILLLNTPGATLSDAVTGAADVVRDRLTHFRTLRARVLRRCADVADAELSEAVAEYLADLDQCVQASWVWQCVSPRYKGTSIFVEDHLA
ncbi:terpene synthase family protein [Nocardia vermiculata]|uniref:terpene synthase family protein n=1 Tax=Nocardia vermiculata TaxID=257274 RepID=UPI000A824D7C|nr:terpene synthase family protein [Nocardia vermiculata]